MPNDIFTKILDERVKQFVNDFCDLPEGLFYDQENNLFHPGEFGKYREETVKKLLKSIFYEDLAISEGFIINNNNEHSTQCDIIVYDYKRTPILKDSNKIFIPVETALGVGEIKSTMSKADFKIALRKLAKNKALKEYATGTIIKRSKPSGDFSPTIESCDQLFSFLICKKLDFSITNIDFDEIYDGIERRNRHNLILSIEDGLFSYHFSFDEMGEERKLFYKSQKVDITMSSVIEFPNYLNVECKHHFISSSESKSHIKEFLSDIDYGIHNATLLNVDIRTYWRNFNRKEQLFE